MNEGWFIFPPSRESTVTTTHLDKTRFCFVKQWANMQLGFQVYPLATTAIH